jgi:hypothetical protein
MDQEPAGGATEQGVGIRDDRDRHSDSAREDLAVEVSPQLPEGTAAARLFAAMPSQHG